jgi:hypothetical protein
MKQSVEGDDVSFDPFARHETVIPGEFARVLDPDSSGGYPVKRRRRTTHMLYKGH